MKLKQQWLDELEKKCKREIIPDKRNKVINYIKWFANAILSTLDNYKNMQNTEFKKWIEKLVDMSLREDMNKYIHLHSRRIQAQKLMFVLEQNKDNFSEKDYNFLRKNIKWVLLENFARQILPETSWIIKKNWHKTEWYLNKNTFLDKNVLEPREYIWIDPLAYSDLDSPSIVTALTPPKYTQPEHLHENNYEITFYTWESIAKYRHNWELVELHADFWDFIIFPPNTIHTIYNPSNESLMNISVKLPWALLDRWSEIDNRPWEWKIQHIQETEKKWIYKAEFDTENVPYFIQIFKFDEIRNNKTTLESWNCKTCFYIIKWDFVWKNTKEKKNNALSQWDTIILDKNQTFEINDLNWDWIIYSVFLTDSE